MCENCQTKNCRRRNVYPYTLCGIINKYVTQFGFVYFRNVRPHIRCSARCPKLNLQHHTLESALISKTPPSLPVCECIVKALCQREMGVDEVIRTTHFITLNPGMCQFCESDNGLFFSQRVRRETRLNGVTNDCR